MTAKSILQSLKSNLERESQFSEENVLVQMQASEKAYKVTVLIPIEGKVRLIEVTAKDLGISDGINVRG